MTQFCTKCGSQLVDRADFCHKCGSKIEMIKGVPTAIPVEPVAEKVPTQVAKVPTQVYDTSKYERRRKVIIGLSVGLVLIIVVPIVLFSVFGFFNYHYIDSYVYDEASMDYTNINLIIDNNVGTVDIYYDDSLSKPFEAVVEVFGRRDSDISNALNFTTEYLNNDTIEVMFDSGDFNFFFWDENVFTYDISFYLNPVTTTDILVDADTGSVSLSTEGLDNLEILNLNLASNTGKVTLDMDNSVNSSIETLHLETDTGRVSVNLGTRTKLDDTEVIIKANTGGIDFTYEDIILEEDILWDIETNTGSIDIDITQNIVYPTDITVDFLVNTNTGSIEVVFSFNTSIGYRFQGDSNTGNEDILGNEDSFIPPNYETASNVYDFLMDAGTGSITVSEK